MARRKLELGIGFTIWRDAALDEYVVKLHGDKSEERAYFTNDLEDARGTGAAMVKHKTTNMLPKGPCPICEDTACEIKSTECGK